MRILHLTDRLTDRGGAHVHLLGVLEGLRARGHEVHLAIGAADARACEPCPMTLLPGLESRVQRGVDVDALCERLRPDVVHLHTVVNPTVLQWAADRPSLITVQDHRYFCPGRGKWRADGEPCREVMGLSTCGTCFEDRSYFTAMHAVTSERLEALRRLEIVVLSRYMKGELEKAGIDGRRIHVEPPFVHGLRPDAAADGPPCLLFAGRLTRAKGPLEALEAWRLSDFRDLPLLFAGTGPERERVAARGGTVLGWVDRVRLSALYRRARAMIMPSRWQEPFGLAGLESLTMGTPVVAWRGGAVEEWHVGPGLVDWGDIRGLAEALPLAASSPVAAPTGFDEEDLMRRLVALYETVG